MTMIRRVDPARATDGMQVESDIRPSSTEPAARRPW